MAITPVWICGAECGAGIGSAGSHIPVTGGTAPTFSTATVHPGSPGGARSVRFNPSANSSRFQIDTLVSTATKVGVFRCYLRFNTKPAADAWILHFGVFISSAGGIRYKNADSTLRPCSSGADSTNGIVITTGVWYCIDLKVNSTANPWTIDMQVDGVAVTQFTLAAAAANISEIIIGTTDSITADFFMDDMIYSQTAADYPIGPGEVDAYSPSSDGTHSFTAGDMRYGDSGGNVATNASDVNTKLSDVPVGSGTLASDSIEQIVVRSTAYVEVKFPTVTTKIPQGVSVILAHHESSTSNNSQIHKLRDNNGATEDAFLTIATAAGVVAQRFAQKCYAVIPGGTGWTNTAFNNLVYRGPFAGLITAIPKIDGVMLEVAFRVQYQTLSGSMTPTGTTAAGAPKQAQQVKSGSFSGKLTGANASQVGQPSLAGSFTGKLTGAIASQGNKVLTGSFTGKLTGGLVRQINDVLSGTFTGKLTGANTSRVNATKTGSFTGKLTGANANQGNKVLTGSFSGKLTGGLVNQVQQVLSGSFTGKLTGLLANLYIPGTHVPIIYTQTLTGVMSAARLTGGLVNVAKARAGSGVMHSTGAISKLVKALATPSGAGSLTPSGTGSIFVKYLTTFVAWLQASADTRTDKQADATTRVDRQGSSDILPSGGPAPTPGDYNKDYNADYSKPTP